MSGNEPLESEPTMNETTEEVGVGGEAVDGPVGRLRKLGRRILDKKELADDTKEFLGAMLETSDKAKTEVVKMVAREVRTYLQELRVMDDLKDIMTSHSLELQVSMNLKPLAEAMGDGADSSEDDTLSDETTVSTEQAEVE